eukprot:232214-Hanusia_phi.AAC.3
MGVFQQFREYLSHRRQRQLLAENFVTSGSDNAGQCMFSTSPAVLTLQADSLIILDEYSSDVVVNDLAKSVAHPSDEGLKWTNIYG